MTGLPALLVGIDIGTTATKAGVVDLDGRERSVGRVVMPWQRVPSGAEMDPRALAATAFQAAEKALQAAPDGRIVAVGVTSMAETGVLADADGEPLAPAIAWHDTRGDEARRHLAATLGEREFVRRTGLKLSVLPSAVKYRWLRAHIPAVRRARRWFSVAEWVVAAFGGDPASELSLASHTGWLDLARRSWWPDALAASGIDADLLAALAPGDRPQGVVHHGPAHLHGAVLALGGHDHRCAAVGVGATRLGEVFDSCGTAEAFVASLPQPPDPDTVERAVAADVVVGWHTLPDRCAAIGAQRAGLALQRVLDLLGVAAGERDALDDAALAAEPGSLRWAGLEDPHASLTGIGWGAGPAQLWRAALEHVGGGGAALLSAVEQIAGPTDRLVVGGGWARSRALRSVKAAHLGPFDHARVREPGVRGAALLAGIAAGVYADVEALPHPPLAGR